MDALSRVSILFASIALTEGEAIMNTYYLLVALFGNFICVLESCHLLCSGTF